MKAGEMTDGEILRELRDDGTGAARREELAAERAERAVLRAAVGRAAAEAGDEARALVAAVLGTAPAP
jgi:hypothetical protein